MRTETTDWRGLGPVIEHHALPPFSTIPNHPTAPWHPQPYGSHQARRVASQWSHKSKVTRRQAPLHLNIPTLYFPPGRGGHGPIQIKSFGKASAHFGFIGGGASRCAISARFILPGTALYYHPVVEYKSMHIPRLTPGLKSGGSSLPSPVHCSAPILPTLRARPRT